ncbi:MAG TPA: glycosyltransferase, partial [Chitinophagaceae bacterium]|nr:glycosyltransferase [Chitinophagaceae bacterium]
LAYAAADVIIARSGALSVAELCLLGKPVIFVPFPYASEDHQTTNALALVKHNAAVMVRDADAKSELLAKVESVLSNEQQQKLLQENILTMAIRDADQRIAQEIIKYVAA